MTDLPPPYVPPELLKHLEALFPNQCPDPDDTDRQVWLDVGKQQVLSTLRRMVTAQEEDAAEGR